MPSKHNKMLHPGTELAVCEIAVASDTNTLNCMQVPLGSNFALIMWDVAVFPSKDEQDFSFGSKESGTSKLLNIRWS